MKPARRSSSLLLAVLVWACAASIAASAEDGRSQAAETTALAAKVGELIAKLDAPRLADRDAAEKALVALGPAALDVLPHADKKLSAEVRQRLVRVRRQLELAFARSAAKASLITLADEERPLSEVLAALAKQSGNAIIDGRAESNPDAASRSDPRIRLAFDKTPFWQALDRTLDAGGYSLKVRDAAGDRSLALVVVARGEGEPSRGERAAYRGPLRFAIKDINVTRASGDDRGLLRVVLETAWEPRLRPISFALAAADLKAADDRRRPLAAATPSAEWATASLGGQAAIRLSLPFDAPAEDARSLSLRGRVTALVGGADVVFRFADPATKPGASVAAAAASQKIGDATVRLESFRRQDDRWQARFRVIYENPHEAVQSHFDWLYTRRAALAIGDELRQPSRYDAQAAHEGVTAMYEFPARDGDRPADFTLEYTTPAVILSLPYEFQFDGIPLPR